jgi:hypothetical protein
MTDRRIASRFTLIANAEVIDLKNDAHLKARTSDISIGGCYLDMVNPLPPGTAIRVQINNQNETFTATGAVVFSNTNMGMGIRFSDVEDAQLEVLKKWLTAEG